MSNIKNAKNSDEIRATLKGMNSMELIKLQSDLSEERMLDREASNMSAALYAGMGAAIGALTVALSQPIAKWQKYTELPFWKYMKHPAAIAAVGLSAATGVVEKYIFRSDVNKTDTLLALKDELRTRKLPPELSTTLLMDRKDFESVTGTPITAPDNTVSEISDAETVKSAEAEIRK